MAAVAEVHTRRLAEEVEGLVQVWARRQSVCGVCVGGVNCTLNTPETQLHFCASTLQRFLVGS